MESIGSIDGSGGRLINPAPSPGPVVLRDVDPVRGREPVTDDPTEPELGTDAERGVEIALPVVAEAAGDVPGATPTGARPQSVQ